AIYVTEGLLRLLRSDAQLANVLGHEVAHIEEKHSMEQIQVNAGSTLVLALINALIGGRIGQEEKDQMTNLTLELVQNGYSQYDENEADEVGQALSTRAGWDPMGMVDVMTIFETLEKDVDPGSIEAYKRSHPYAKDRHRKAYSRIKNNELPVTGGEVVGAETYAKFLSDILKVPAGEEKESPIKAATEFLPPSPELIAARKVALAQAKPKMDWQMILGIGLVGFGILAVILTKKK
nr:M48 family metalloprotease [Gemmatimonadales bacterium]